MNKEEIVKSCNNICNNIMNTLVQKRFFKQNKSNTDIVFEEIDKVEREKFINKILKIYNL